MILTERCTRCKKNKFGPLINLTDTIQLCVECDKEFKALKNLEAEIEYEFKQNYSEWETLDKTDNNRLTKRGWLKAHKILVELEDYYRIKMEEMQKFQEGIYQMMRYIDENQ